MKINLPPLPVDPNACKVIHELPEHTDHAVPTFTPPELEVAREALRIKDTSKRAMRINDISKRARIRVTHRRHQRTRGWR